MGLMKLSVKMILLCSDTIIIPLKIIFENIIATGIYPDIWKRANVIPMHKKENKQILRNY